jgi:DNA-binding SARP family transcriptional activator
VRLRLIGPPHIEDGDILRPVRGHQVWALLVRLLLADRPLTRSELSAELFPGTADPLGSLRWCLAATRRALGAPNALSGDPVAVDLPEHVTADLLDLLAGRYDESEVGDLLEGVEPRCSAEFDLWLMVQRQRVAARIDGLLRREVIAASAMGHTDRALALAEFAARRQMLDEGAQILLVASLRAAGRYAAAAAVVDEVETRFRAELGTAPSPALRGAARAHVAATPPGVPWRSRALSLLEAGQAALAAAAVDSGVETLRQAARVAEESSDNQMLGRCLRELGTALVHAVRSHDDEGALLLQRAAEVAAAVGDASTTAAAHRELGYIDAVAGRRPGAEEHLAQAEALVVGDTEQLASIRSVRAFNLTDWGRLDDALEEWGTALDLSRSAANPRRLAWTLGLGGWAQVRAGYHGSAATWLRECLNVVTSSGWISFRPWPVAVLAEAELAAGSPARMLDLHQEFALSCQLADPSLESATARALALQTAGGGDIGGALTWVDEARRRVGRGTDVCVGMQGAILATDIELSTSRGEGDRAAASARTLLELAARTHMDGYLDQAMATMRPAR